MTKPFWRFPLFLRIFFHTNKNRQSEGQVGHDYTRAKYHHLQHTHLHLVPVWTRVWWDTWYTLNTGTLLSTMPALALNVEKYKYLKPAKSERKWVRTKRQRHRSASSSLGTNLWHFAHLCVFFSWWSIVAAASVFEHVTLQYETDHLCR